MDTVNTELIRGHVDTIILNSLAEQDRYGYEILDIISNLSEGRYEIKQPTLYSCLKRLEKQGFIESYFGEESNGGRRRYYKLTEKGKETLEQDQREWEFSRTIINKLLSDKEIDLKTVEAPFDPNELRPLTRRVRAHDKEDEVAATVSQEPIVKYVYIPQYVHVPASQPLPQNPTIPEGAVLESPSVVPEGVTPETKEEYVPTVEEALNALYSTNVQQVEKVEVIEEAVEEEKPHVEEIKVEEEIIPVQEEVISTQEKEEKAPLKESIDYFSDVIMPAVDLKEEPEEVSEEENEVEAKLAQIEKEEQTKPAKEEIQEKLDPTREEINLFNYLSGSVDTKPKVTTVEKEDGTLITKPNSQLYKKNNVNNEITESNIKDLFASEREEFDKSVRDFKEEKESVEEYKPDEYSTYNVKVVERILNESRTEAARNDKARVLKIWNVMNRDIDNDYVHIAKLLQQGTITAVGNKEFILVYPNAAMCNQVMRMKFKKESLKLLYDLFGDAYNYMALPENIWQEKRSEYHSQYYTGTKNIRLTPINDPALTVLKDDQEYYDEKKKAINKVKEMFGDELVKVE